jgi:hypothetical protein
MEKSRHWAILLLPSIEKKQKEDPTTLAVLHGNLLRTDHVMEMLVEMLVDRNPELPYYYHST